MFGESMGKYESISGKWRNLQFSSHQVLQVQAFPATILRTQGWQCFITFVFSFNRISLFRASRIFSRRVWNIQLMLHSRKDNIWGLYLITAISKHLSLKHCSNGWFLIAMAFLESKDEKQTMRNLSKTSTFGETYTSWNQRMSNKQTMRNLSKKKHSLLRNLHLSCRWAPGGRCCRCCNQQSQDIPWNKLIVHC